MLQLCGILNLYIMLVCNDGSFDDIHVELIFDYVYYVKYYLTTSGRLVDRLPICMNG